MHTACSLTVSRSICHTCPPAMPPASPLPCTPPAMHAPYHACPPSHAHPHHACPPATHAPTMHTPCHTHYHPPPHMPPPQPHMPPLPHMPPTAMHTPPRGQNSWHTRLKILPCPNIVAGGNKPAEVSFCRVTNKKNIQDLTVEAISTHTLNLTETRIFSPCNDKAEAKCNVW